MRFCVRAADHHDERTDISTEARLSDSLSNNEELTEEEEGRRQVFKSLSSIAVSASLLVVSLLASSFKDEQIQCWFWLPDESFVSLSLSLSLSLDVFEQFFIFQEFRFERKC